MIMKLTIALLLFFTFRVSAKTDAQKITIVKDNIRLSEVFKDIEQQTGFHFFYDKDVIEKTNPIDVLLKDATLQQALQTCLSGQHLIYNIVRNTVVIMPQKQTTFFASQATLTPIQPIESPPIEIHGRVVNQQGEPLQNVSVLISGTTIGTITNNEGRFILTAPNDKNIVLEISSVGYQMKKVSVGKQTEINITLELDISGLNDVVVVGYGTQRKGDVTAAIASVKSEDFVKGSVTDAAQLIRGKVAGLAVITPDANPTSTSQINLRGITTIGASTTPLVLIDGIPGTLTTVAPENIESIDVLKDGSAAAIYGTRGTNGVILITTKKVNGAMEPTVDLNAYFTTQSITKKLPFMNTSQYRELVAQNKPGAFDYGANTNWFDQITQKPFSQVYNISLKGGSRNTNYIVNLNYRDLNGIIKRSNNILLYPSIKVNHSMFDGKLKLSADLSGYEQHYFSGSDGGSYNNRIYKNALTFNPSDPVKDADGNWTEHIDKTDYANPVSLLRETNGLNQNSNLRTSATITYDPVKDINIKLLASRDLYNSTRGYSETKKHYSTLHDGRNGYASRGTTRSEEDLLELTATYNKHLGDHHITALVGYSWLQYNYQDYWMQNWDFPTSQFSYNNMGAGLALKRGQAPESSTQSQNKLIGYFARVNYSYKDKYLLTASIRREGSSKFGTNYKYGNFPAISAGWNIKRESFMDGLSFISALKLRGGFGITGTEPSNPYVSLKRLNFNQFVYIDGQWIQVANLAQNPNPDLRWEKKEEANIGLDFGFLENRIAGSVDLYKRTTRDLLFNYPVATPPYLYSSIFANAASMENKGIEVQVNAIPVETKDFSWNTTVNYSTNQNKLLSLSDKSFQLASGYFDAGNTSEPIQQSTHRVQIGEPIGNFWGFKSVDIDENGHWIIMGKDGKAKPISEQQADDKQIIGNGLPKSYLSWNNTLRYKNFDLNITMRGAFGFQILNMPNMFYSAPVMLTRGNLLTNAYDKIYGKHALADNQELQYVSYYIEDGDYWKIDNITLGYNFKLNSKYIKFMRIYASCSNIKTFTGYTGIDPEVGILGLAPGTDDKYRYPATSPYSLGAFFTF
jgi:TonB-linked SusC/RagA family outer membrane protein